jgi:hypothetical protein
LRRFRLDHNIDGDQFFIKKLLIPADGFLVILRLLHEGFTLPRLKLKVENALNGYLTDEVTDEEFKEKIQLILDQFEGKNLLHQNIGQLAWRVEGENPGKKTNSRRSGFYSIK